MAEEPESTHEPEDLLTGTDHPAVAPPEEPGSTHEPEEFRPVGTIAFLLVYAVVLILLWLAMYLTMLSRGGTS